MQLADLSASVPFGSLNEWDVQLAPRMPNMAARKLEPPIVAYARNRQAQPSQGAWRMQRNQDRFVQGMTCSSFAVVLANPRLAGQTSDFLGAFWTGAQGLGESSRRPPRRPS